MATNISLPLSILRRKQVEARTGLSRSGIYARLRFNPDRPGDHDPTFPKPVNLGPRSVGWIESEVDAWIAQRVEHSRQIAQ